MDKVFICNVQTVYSMLKTSKILTIELQTCALLKALKNKYRLLLPDFQIDF